MLSAMFSANQSLLWPSYGMEEVFRPATHFISIDVAKYTDFFPKKSSKIGDFYVECGRSSIFSVCTRVFYPSSHVTDFLVLYTNFVLDHSGRSGYLSPCGFVEITKSIDLKVKRIEHFSSI